MAPATELLAKTGFRTPVTENCTVLLTRDHRAGHVPTAREMENAQVVVNVPDDRLYLCCNDEVIYFDLARPSAPNGIAP